MAETTPLVRSDIFEKAFGFTKADEVKAMGLYPYFKPLEATDGTIVEIEGNEVIMAGSNNYLGLTNDPRTIEAAKKCIGKVWDRLYRFTIFKWYP
jgi:8-amino-7-oxononanoate synthase